MGPGSIDRDDIWEVTLELWAHAHGYIALYRAGRFSLPPEDFKELVHRSMRRLFQGLKARLASLTAPILAGETVMRAIACAILTAAGCYFAFGLGNADILGPSLLFALAAVRAQRVKTALGPVAAMLAFAALWAGSDLLAAFDPAVGSIVSPATAEVAAPVLIQSAALVGFVGGMP